MKVENEDIFNSYLKSNNIKANYLFINNDFLYIIKNKKIINIKNNPDLKDHLILNKADFLYIDIINNNFIIKNNSNNNMLMHFFEIKEEKEKTKEEKEEKGKITITKKILTINIKDNILSFGSINSYLEKFDSGLDIFNTFELIAEKEDFITQTQLITMFKDFINLNLYLEIINIYIKEGFNIYEFFENNVFNKKNVNKYIDSTNTLLYLFIFIENLKIIARSNNIKKIKYDKELFLFMTLKYSITNDIKYKDPNILITFQGAISTIIIFNEVIKLFKNDPDKLSYIMNLTSKYFSVLIKERKSNNNYIPNNKDVFLDDIDDDFFLLGYWFLMSITNKNTIELSILNNLLSNFLYYDNFNEKDYFEAIKYIDKISKNYKNSDYTKLILLEMYNNFIFKKSHIYKKYISIAFIYHLQNSLINNKLNSKNIPKIKKSLNSDLVNNVYTQKLILEMSDIDNDMIPLIQTFLNIEPTTALKLINK